MNTPNLRFKGFIDSWKKCKIGDFFEHLATGSTPSRLKPEYFNGDIPWISSGELKSHYVSSTKEYITIEAIKKTNLKIHPAGTLFIAITGLEAKGTRSSAAINTVPMTTNQSCLAFPLNKYIVLDFLYHWYKKNGEQIGITFTQGTKQQSLTPNLVKNLDIYIPNEKIEQVKIAEFLNLYDQKIKLQQERIDLLKKQKKGFMQKIFSQKLSFRDENGQEFPKWEKVRLGKLTKKTGKKNSKGIKYPIAAISNKKGFILEGGRNYSNADVDIKAYKLVHQNEFAYNPARINVGSFGLQNVTDTTIVSSLYVVFETLPELIQSYLKAYMHSRYFNQDVIKNTEGSVREYLFYENFANIKIPLPCVAEQKKIAEFLTSLDSKIILEMQILEHLDNQKKSFMQQMFI